MNRNILIITNDHLILSDTPAIYSDEHIVIRSTLESDFNARVTIKDTAVQVEIGNLSQSRIGALLRYDTRNCNLMLRTDRFGTETIYHEIKNGRLMLSNRMEPFCAGDRRIDPAALYQYLISGYTVGSGTLLEGVSQSLCGEELLFEQSGSGWHYSSRLREWASDVNPGKSHRPALSETISRISTQINDSALMMSAGWDSRTLLTAADPRRVVAYTHGDLSSREITLTRQMTGQMRMDHLVVDTVNNAIDVPLIDEMLDDLGHAVFPLWYIAAQKIRSTWNLPMSAGIFGEFLGGHWGVDKLIGTRGRASSLLKFLVPNYRTRMDLSSLLDALAPSRDLWYLTADARQSIFDEADELINRTRVEFESYGSIPIDVASEQFMARHKGRQYLLKQAHASKSSVGYVLPFADDELFDAVIDRPFMDRVHNRLNRDIVTHLNPSLLNYPLAATLAKANRPIAVQELSRLARLGIEKTTGKHNFGWFNFDFLADAPFFDDLINSLVLDIWDKDAMRRTIDIHKAAQDHKVLGYTLDTLCKVKTVDRLGSMLAGSVFR